EELTPQDGQRAHRAHERVAREPERAAIGLERRGEDAARPLVVARMAAARERVAAQRRGSPGLGVERGAQRERVEERESRALPELRTGAVRRVSDERDASAHPLRYAHVGIGGDREILETRE